MTFNIIQQCLNLQATLSSKDYLRCTRTELIESALHGLLEMGFTNSRLYDVVFNVPRKDDILILSACAGPACPHLTIGYTIHYRESTLGQHGIPSRSLVDNYAVAIGRTSPPKWIDELGLQDSSWIDIPLLHGEKLLGVIACDWRGKPSDLSLEQRSLLDMLGSLIAAKLNMIPMAMFEKARTRLTDLAKDCDDTGQLLTCFLDLCCTSFDIGIGAAFLYEWDTSRLCKMAEVGHPTIRGRLTPFPEEYGLGECLTGEAWSNDDYKYIVNFPSLIETEKDKTKVYQPSLDRHTALLGMLTSTFYQVVGKREQQYLLRFMNRVDDARLPLLPSHIGLVGKLCSDLSDIIDDASSARRLSNLQRVSRTVVQNLANPRDIIRTVAECIAQEGMANTAVMADTKESTYFSHEYYMGPLFRNWKGAATCPWKDETFYVAASEGEGPRVIDLGSLDCHSREDCVIGFLYGQGIRHVLTMPFVSARGKGLVMCPLKHNPYAPHKPAIAALKKSQSGKYSILATYAHIAGNAIDAADSHLTAEGAQKLIAHIGHEVTTPAAVMGQVTLEAIYKMQKNLLPEMDGYRHLLDGLVKDIKKEMQTMGTTMQVATMVAQQNQRLRIHFRPVNVGQVLRESAATVMGSYAAYDPAGEVREYKIDVGSSCDRLGSVVCDDDLMRMVFGNLLKNAVKYSLPRYKGKPMVVSVLGQPQTNMSIVQFKNWGFGVPAEEFERIFRPYVRGSVTDKKKAIRGMGLGLYIARRIMTAHKGQVFCQSSEQRLDFALNRADWEGYETVFEVRLPHDLKEGVAEYSWEDWV